MAAQHAGPLQDVVVLDLTRVVAGPYCTSYLADMGAQVIKVENPSDGGDHSRDSAPMVNGVSAWYAALNRGKKTVTLNLKDPKGRELFLELVKKADIVTENFRPGVMEKLGLSYETLKSLNPRIILASVSGYGSYGPYTQRPGYDVIAQGMGGIMSVTGFEDGPPTKVGTTLGDITAGMNLAIGILAALHGARTTGVGQRLEVALVDSIFALNAHEYISYAISGNVPTRKGNHYNIWCPYGTYRAKDGYYQLGVGTDKHFRLLCAVMEQPELGTLPCYATHADRMANRDSLNQIIDNWASSRTVNEVVSLLNEAGIPSSGVYDFADISNDPHFTQRDMIKHMDHPVIGDLTYVNSPIRFFGTPLETPAPAGDLGQYNHEVYQNLGLTDEQIDKLRQDGVI